MNREVTVVIHSAARIALEDPIQVTLRHNYQSTLSVMKAAQAMQNLHSIVHISTTFVNINHPSGSSIAEKIYPLKFGDQENLHSIVHVSTTFVNINHPSGSAVAQKICPLRLVDQENLHSKVHVSTTFVNINHPSGSAVAQKIYPLKFGDLERFSHRQEDLSAEVR
eukprot:gene32191-16734_t